MRQFILIGILAATLSACSFGVPIGNRTDSDEGTLPPLTRTSRGNPPSYVVAGKRYHVLNSAAGFRQRGIASWYGKKFHGRQTSNGEIYDMYGMTAAHKTLPIPVYVRVKNLENDRSIVVKVNDRGPFIEGRIIDLSYTAAQKLDIVRAGTGKVEINVLIPGQSTSETVARAIPLPDLAQEDAPLFIQLGSFGQEANAVNLLRDLHDAQEQAASISQLETGGELFYRVRVGPLYDLDEANAVIFRLKHKGYETARIVTQE